VHAVQADERGGVLRRRAPVGRAEIIPVLLDASVIAGEQVGEDHAVELFGVLDAVDLLRLADEAAEIVLHGLGIRELSVARVVGVAVPEVLDPLAVPVGRVVSLDDRGIDVPAFEERLDLVVFESEPGRAGAVVEPFPGFGPAIAADMVFLLEHEVIAAEAALGRGQAGGAAADDDHIQIARGRRRGFQQAVADVVADLIGFGGEAGRGRAAGLALAGGAQPNGEADAAPAITHLMKERREMSTRAH